jgi:hypothetical protein
MSFDLSALDPLRAARVEPPRPGARAAAPSGGGFADALAKKQSAAGVDAIPASPPPEVVDEMLAAQRAIADMHARGRELHFNMDSGRLRIEVRDLAGNVIKQIPPSRALEIAGGRAVE